MVVFKDAEAARKHGKRGAEAMWHGSRFMIEGKPYTTAALTLMAGCSKAAMRKRLSEARHKEGPVTLAKLGIKTDDL